MQGSAIRSPIRKPDPAPNRDVIVREGRTFKEFRFGEVLPKEMPKALLESLHPADVAHLTPEATKRLLKWDPTPVQPFIEFRPVHGPRIPRDKLERKRGKYRRDL